MIDTEPSRTRADQQDKKEHVQDFRKVEEIVEPVKSDCRNKNGRFSSHRAIPPNLRVAIVSVVVCF
jgi:hypothetical protein